MQKRLLEFHRRALLKVRSQLQDGEGVTTRRQARVDQPAAPLAVVQSPVVQPTAPLQRPIVEQKKNVPFQKEEIVLSNDNLKIFVVKSDLKRMVQFKMLDHQFILRVEVRILEKIFL